ncbi:MAG: DUF4974 domain-containing protein [Prevotella sp.]|nr:DUF4974 domain-containing protein [Prevotella sp.]
MKNEKQIRMLLHPEQYTDGQLDQMLDDTQIPVPDVEEEWQRFKARGQGKRRRQPMRWAAILITVAALSGISYAAIHHFSKVREERAATATTVQQQQPTLQQEEKRLVPQNIVTTVEENDSTRHDQHFNNVPLQQIMQQVSQDYGVTVEFKNAAARDVRFYLNWDADETLPDIINRINHFEKVHLTLSGETITIN